MKTIVLYIDKGSILFGEKEIMIGMSYEEVILLFQSSIISNVEFEDMNGVACSCIRLEDAIILGVQAVLEVRIYKGEVNKMIFHLDSNDTVVTSNNTGVKLYQEKVIETAKIVKEQIMLSHRVTLNGDNLFQLTENGFYFYSAYDREGMESFITLERSGEHEFVEE